MHKTKGYFLSNNFSQQYFTIKIAKLKLSVCSALSLFTLVISFCILLRLASIKKKNQDFILYSTVITVPEPVSSTQHNPWYSRVCSHYEEMQRLSIFGLCILLFAIKMNSNRNEKQTLEMQHTMQMRKRMQSVLFLDHLGFVFSKKYQCKFGNMKKIWIYHS